MATLFRSVRARMKHLGLNFTAWDSEGRGFSEFDRICEFCQTIYGRSVPCESSVNEVVLQVCREGRPAWRGLSDDGCRIMGVPIRQRRRILGAAVACYPTRQWLDEEYLARRCDALKLDRQVVASLALENCRHAAGEVEDLLGVLEWAVTNEQSLQTAKEELTTLSTNLSSTYEELSLLYSISGSMKVTQQPQEFLTDVCEQVREVMNISAAAAVVYSHPPAIPEDIVVVLGEIDLTADQIRALVSAQIAPLISNNRPLVDNQFVWRADPGSGRAVRNMIATPLVNEQSLGMLLALNKNVGDFNSTDLKLISSIGNQSAIFLANNILYADLQDLLMGVLHALTATIDAKDPYTCGHSNRVAIISRRLAQKCGLGPDRVQQIYLAGLLHDIGKIGVPESTLCKPGRLTDEEFEQIKKHPGIGAKILGGIRQLDDVIAGILCHHERLDGRGYPQGLKLDDVPSEARIIGLADCFDAMTSDRIYRKALPLSEVIEEIRTHAGTQFDPMVVQKLLAMDLEAFLEELRQPVQTVFPVSFQKETGR